MAYKLLHCIIFWYAETIDMVWCLGTERMTVTLSRIMWMRGINAENVSILFKRKDPLHKCIIQNNYYCLFSHCDGRWRITYFLLHSSITFKEYLHIMASHRLLYPWLMTSAYSKEHREEGMIKITSAFSALLFSSPEILKACFLKLDLKVQSHEYQRVRCTQDEMLMSVW